MNEVMNLSFFSATTCAHLQCFDALLFLQMNELKPKWKCPICNVMILYDDIVIDGYFLNVIASLDYDINEIQLNKDGSWTKLEEGKENHDKNDSRQKKNDAEVIVCDDEDDIPAAVAAAVVKSSNNNSHQHTDDQNNNKVEPKTPPSRIKIVSSRLQNKRKKPKVEAASKDEPSKLPVAETIDLTLDD